MNIIVTLEQTNRLYYIRSLEESVLAPGPECEMAFSVCNKKIIVQWVKRRASQVIL
jgi:hypothetical protein